MAEYLSKDDISTGEYISRDEALKAMQYCCENCDNYNGAMCRACDNADEMDIICDIPAADVQPIRKWVNDNISSPSVDGDYLVFYRSFFHVFERFKGKWYDEDGCDVTADLDKLWWQELPPMPETIKR